MERPVAFLRVVVAAVSISFMLAGPAASAATPPVTETTIRHNVVERYVDVAPSCDGDGPLYSFTTITNTVRHLTVFPDGRVHIATAYTGRFVAEPLDGAEGPTYSGRFTIKNGGNLDNSVSGIFNYTLSITGSGSDGSRLRVNAVEHFSLAPNGTVKLFFRCH
jgi:hypothetical protein